MSEEEKKQAQRIAETVKDASDYQKTAIAAFAEGLVQGMEIAERRNKFVDETLEKSKTKKAKEEK